MPKPPSSRLGRLARIGGLTSRVTSSYVGQRVAGLFQDEDARRQALDKLHLRNAEQIVETMGRLKGAAMKAGQQFAQLADTLDLPDEVQSVLGRLHDQAEPVPFEVVKRSLERSLDRGIETAFAHFDPAPLGTASLGQAHLARTHDGEDVVVKVLHDGIEGTVASDLGALKALLVGGRVLRRDRQEIDEAFEEVRARLEEELDYLHEAANIEAYGARLGDDPGLRIPRTFPALSSERVLTMERLPGVPLRRFLETGGRAARERAGQTLARTYYRSAFGERILHADPHPGNFLFEEDGRVGLLDFGCLKRLDEYFVADYARTAIAAVDGDRDETLRLCRHVGAWAGDDPKAAERLWTFCDTLAVPYRPRSFTLGGPQDRMMEATARAVRGLLLYPEIRAPRELLYMHRTLGGLYTIARQLVFPVELGGLLREHGGTAIARAEGRLPG